MSADIEPAIQSAVRGLLPDLTVAIGHAVREAVDAALHDRLVSVDEAAGLLGCTPAALRKRICRGDVAVVRSGRTVRLRYGDLLGNK